MKRHIYILFSFVLYLHGLAQNTSNVSGSFDIGPIGNATYNIPIDLPPGTAGLQPNISIVYNSFSGDGIMGKGFSVSAITCNRSLLICNRSARNFNCNCDSSPDAYKTVPTVSATF